MPSCANEFHWIVMELDEIIFSNTVESAAFQLKFHILGSSMDSRAKSHHSLLWEAFVIFCYSDPMYFLTLLGVRFCCQPFHRHLFLERTPKKYYAARKNIPILAEIHLRNENIFRSKKYWRGKSRNTGCIKWREITHYKGW